MTAQTAIDILRNVRPYELDEDEYNEAREAAIRALEKQMPKKPDPDKTWGRQGKCPLCGVLFLDKLTKHCGNCGQALNWSDDA